MRRILSFVLAALIVFTVSGLVFSQETVTESKSKETEGTLITAPASIKGQASKPQEKMKRMFPMSAMMNKSLVATSDGGAVVMVGNKLMKFDKDLNLIKEVEIKMDTEGMEQTMMQMKEKHHMMNKPAQESTAKESAVKQESSLTK